MEYQWVFKPEGDNTTALALAEKINVNPILANVLVQRGVATFEEAKKYFVPSLDQLHDPFLMKDMTKAVNRLNEAISSSQRILIYGDYDVDGTCSVSMFYNFLKEFYTKIEYYIPDRYSEGYGISAKGIEYAHENGFDLIISIDCGITAVDLIQRAKDYGIDTIVCDHHKPGLEIPDAYAILNPKQVDCSYPFDELCGCGVAFKLLQAFCIQNDIDEAVLFDRLDFVAVATSSDIVPMIGENRLLTFFGIQRLLENTRPGFKALLDVAGMVGRKLKVMDVVFGIGPRINAAGRLHHAHHAVEVLLSETFEEAIEYARAINAYNEERRNLDQSITADALERLEKSDTKSTVLFNPNWHKGVIGIVASRCMEKYYRPSIILTEHEGKVTGSARSVKGFDIYNALSECSDVLEQFGGHMYAAGLTMLPEKVKEFEARFEDVVSRTIDENDLIPKIEIDFEVELKKITENFEKILGRMEPFGPCNMEPVFVAKNVNDTGSAKLLKEKHLKLSLTQKGSYPLSAIGFNMEHLYDLVKNGKKFDVCFTVGINEFRGNSSIQLMIKDIKPVTF